MPIFDTFDDLIDDICGLGMDTVNVQVNPIPAAIINCDPDTINLKSKGKWIACHIGLPEGYGVEKVTGEQEKVISKIVEGSLTISQQEYFDSLLQDIDGSVATVDINIRVQANNSEYTINGYLSDDGNAILLNLIEDLENNGNDVELDITKDITWGDYTTFIDINTVTFIDINNGTFDMIPALNDVKYGFVKNPKIDDTNDDGLPELMVKFDKESVQSILESGDNDMLLHGKVYYNSGLLIFRACM